MKAMTWLKVGGGVLVVLAAIASADTRRMQVEAKTGFDPDSRVIASEAGGCPSSHQHATKVESDCCKKEVEPEAKASGCCRKD